MGGLFSQEEEKPVEDKPVEDKPVEPVKPVKPVDDTPFKVYIGVSPGSTSISFVVVFFFIRFDLSLSVLILSKVVSHTKTLCYQTVPRPCVQTR